MMQKKHAALAGIAVVGLGILGYAVMSDRSEARHQVAAPLPSGAPARVAPLASAVPAASGIPARSAEQLLEASCSAEKSKDCGCRKAAVLAGFERAPDLIAAAELAKQTEAECASDFAGLVAEGLARLGRIDEASAAARATLTRDPKNPYAAYAEALSSYRSNQPAHARKAAERAASFGRGAPAEVLLGMIEYEQKNFDEAERLFKRAIEADPKHSDAVFNLGVLHQRRNDYRLAREAYLKALALNPTHVDARYNLAILTLGAGATSEARHHFEKLKASAGSNDARVSRLAARLDGRPGQVAPELQLRATQK